MSLYVLVGTVALSIIGSIATFITHIWYPQDFVTAALITAGSVLFGALYVGGTLLWIALTESYLK